MNKKLKVGDSYSDQFTISQRDVYIFMGLSGDDNNIHTDPAAAAKSPIGGKIAVPGFLPAMHFSRVLGAILPGHGTAYRNQSLYWRRPTYIDTPYVVEVTITSIEYPTDEFGQPKIPRATVDTIIRDALTGEIVLKGEAVVLHKELFGSASSQS